MVKGFRGQRGQFGRPSILRPMTQGMIADGRRRPWGFVLEAIEGWFHPADWYAFDWLLAGQEARQMTGDLLELGTYKGKSAVFLGGYLNEGEKFTVCDLFDSPAPDSATTTEMRVYYPTLTRQIFEKTYLSFHEKLPVIIQGASSVIASHVKPGTCRFVHVDASHLYHHVKADIETARELLLPEGIIALDDYRSAHTPGVAAATWEAVLNGGLKPVLLTEFKLYGTWGDAAALQEPLLQWLASHRDIWGVAEDVAGHSLVRMHYR